MKDLTSKKLIRNFNLHLLTGSKLEEPYLSIYNDLKKIFKDLNIYLSSKPNLSSYVFYGTAKNDLYITYEKERGVIALDDINVWSVLENRYELSKDEVCGITTWYVTNFLHLRGTTHKYVRNENSAGIENNLYLKK